MIHRRIRLIIVLLLALCAAAPFLQTVRHDFVNYDDPLYVTENPHVRRGLTLDGVRWAFTRIYAGNWHPLTWLSHMLDVSLFGLAPGGHHLVNVLWHVLNTVLLYLVLFHMTGAHRASALVACLFALHPAHVESVAWISERKDLVSTFFGLACIGAYTSYARAPSVGKYLGVFMLLAMGLMAKSMLVTWPCLLLLLDIWPLNRFRESSKTGGPDVLFRRFGRILGEKIPLLVLSAVSSAITIHSHQQAGALGNLDTHPLFERIAGALVSYSGYLERIIWPFDLVVFYPPLESVSPAGAFFSLLLLLGITLTALFSAGRRPYLMVGWLWYLGTLVPVIGLVRQGSQSMPDHFSYVSYIGLFIMIVWIIDDAVRSKPRQAVFLTAAVGPLLFLLMVNAWIQASFWSDSMTLFRRNLSIHPGNTVAHHNLALALDGAGQTEEAVHHYRQALSISPDSAKTLNNLGVSLVRAGDPEQAFRMFSRAIEIHPSHAAAYQNLGLLLNAAGRNEEAIDRLNRALKILADTQTEAWAESGEGHVLNKIDLDFHLGRIQVETGQADAGIAVYRRLEPDRPDLAARLALALACHWHHRGDMLNAVVWGARARHYDLFDPDLLKSEEGMDRICRSRAWLNPLMAR